MSPRLTRSEQRARTRTDLIQAAVRLFAEHGVAATSVEAVAEAAGYSRGAYHSNFASREELLDAVASVAVDELGPGLAATLASETSTLERLAGYVERFLDYCERSPLPTRALVAVVAHRTMSGRPSYEDLVAASSDGLADLFEEGQRTGEMRPFDVALMAALVRRTLDAVAPVVASRGGAATCAAELAETFVRAVRADRIDVPE